MISLRIGMVAAVLAVALSATSAVATAADAVRGGVLYDARCKACHANSVFQKGARKARSFEALRAQVLRWSEQAGGAWGADEIDDITLYLNQRFYRFPCPETLCKANQALLAR